MRFLFKSKDGGPESSVTGYWLIEWKKLFSIVLLKFEGRSREAFHTHAFNCFSWVLRGELIENFLDTYKCVFHTASWKPFITRRTDFHKVHSIKTTWVLSFRGPWSDTWKEYIPITNETVTLTHGRKKI